MLSSHDMGFGTRDTYFIHIAVYVHKTVVPVAVINRVSCFRAGERNTGIYFIWNRMKEIRRKRQRVKS